LFFTVIVDTALLVPSPTEPKLIEAVDSVIGVTPVPLRVVVNGLPRPVYATERVPVCAPVVVGPKVTLTVQVELAAKELPHAFVSAKGAAVEMLSPAIAVLEEFFTLIVEAALVVPSPTEPKLWDAGEIVTGAVPVPVSVMVWVAGVALSVITTLPVTAPRAVGAKAMVMTHRPLAATEVPQVLVSVKPVPLAPILAMLSAAVVLVLRRVTFALLVEPTATDPNECELFERVTVWACAVCIAAASTKRRATSSTRVGIAKERDGVFIQSPADVDCGSLEARGGNSRPELKCWTFLFG
jgi:hypothetical protein